MFCALLMSRYQVSVYRTNGPLVQPKFILNSFLNFADIILLSVFWRFTSYTYS